LVLSELGVDGFVDDDSELESVEPDPEPFELDVPVEPVAPFRP
jgi:hypothetical protein